MFEPSLRRLTWPDGAQATCFSAAKPHSLRDPQLTAPAGQAQKEVIVNEALARLDLLVTPAVEAALPPAT